MTDSPDSAFKTFETVFNAGRTQLVHEWVPADLYTPVSAYLKLSHTHSYGFLLESVEGGTTLGRYSAIGVDPDFFWRYEDGQAQHSPDGKTWTAQAGHALDDLKSTLTLSALDHIPEDLPPLTTAGLYGYLGYDMIRLVEAIPDKNPDTLGIPQSFLFRPTLMIIFDNVRNMVCIATPVRLHKDNSPQTAQAAYDEARARIDDTIRTLRAAIPEAALHAHTNLSLPLAVESNMAKEQYFEMVEKGVEYIHAGEIFQIVPSQRFSTPFDLPPFALYRALRRINPSPFLFFLNCGDFALVGSSPEILVRVRDNTVTIRPIAGTRKRGADAAEDKALAEDLLSDPKERAEHLMLLDLGRNDVGRVAEIGSVTVTEQFIVEYYSHVMHIVSNVEGRLRAGTSPLDALFAGFPAGTVSGAPKIRAMEIIDELEPVKRSFYGGCVGYFDGHGNVNNCIALRTGLVKDGILHVQAGGGVVADSTPEFEYQETVNKARALIRAAELAVQESSEPA